MWYVCFLGTNSAGQSALFVYGPFASENLATQFAYGLSVNPLTSVVQVFSPPPPYGNGNPVPVNAAVGQWVVAQSYTDLLGNSSYNLFGAFTSSTAASGFILSLAYPNGTLAVQIQAAS